jgi:hypothetical protein
MHLALVALHLTLQARYPNCSGCHFELKQVGTPMPIEHANAF